MNTTGYYDYVPTVSMVRSVILGGMLSVPFREIGYELAALTGVRLIDLDHWLEHLLGQSLWDYRKSLKDPNIRLLERQVLQKALRSSPKSLILAGEGTLSDQGSLNVIRASSALVFLKLSPMTAFQNMLGMIQEKGPGYILFTWFVEIRVKEGGRPQGPAVKVVWGAAPRPLAQRTAGLPLWNGDLSSPPC